jgi:starch phosphorylase
MRAALPEKLVPLLDLAYDLAWSWDPAATAFFQNLDPDLWVKTGRNPVALLAALGPDQLEALAQSRGVLAHVGSIRDSMEARPAAAGAVLDPALGTVVYASLAIAIHESLCGSSAERGVLAGDHLKAACDLGLPVVGVGLFGDPRESSDRCIAAEVVHPGLSIDLGPPAGQVRARVWRARMGQVPLVLLDTDVEGNSREQRSLSHHRVGESPVRLARKAMLLGIGGLEALEHLGLPPFVCHLHGYPAAFLALARIVARLEETGESFETARRALERSNALTLDTEWEGDGRVPVEDATRLLSPLSSRLDFPVQELLRLGEGPGSSGEECFSLRSLAVNLTAPSNRIERNALPRSGGVHGRIVSGVHGPSWVAPESSRLWGRHVESRWYDGGGQSDTWSRVDEIPDTELWRARRLQKRRLVDLIRGRLARRVRSGIESPTSAYDAARTLDPEVLTLGFSGTIPVNTGAVLLLGDEDRFCGLVNDLDRPVQCVFLSDSLRDPGVLTRHLRRLIEIARRPEFCRRISIVDEHDIEALRVLVQGIDVWFQDPGESSVVRDANCVRAALNGGLPRWILGGWVWEEAFGVRAPQTTGVVPPQDHGESQRTREFYVRLLHDVVRSYFERDDAGVPRGWMALVRRAIQSLVPGTTAQETVRMCSESYYVPHSSPTVEGDARRRRRREPAERATVRERFRRER